jgi:hypothetical protein
LRNIGPHVEKPDLPGAAFVGLKVFPPGIGKSATITRKLSSPKKPNIVAADDNVKAALAEIAEHPEITLSRREILRFILVEPTQAAGANSNHSQTRRDRPEPLRERDVPLALGRKKLVAHRESSNRGHPLHHGDLQTAARSTYANTSTTSCLSSHLGQPKTSPSRR